MMARLYDDIQLNLVPGITSIDEFFSDDIHPSDLGSYAVAMIHYACIYNESPVGLSNDLMPNAPAGFQKPSPALALYLQTMIWEVVTSYPRTGITDPTLSTVNVVEEDKIVVYPNPVKEYLYVKKDEINQNEQNFIYNSIGQEVYEGFENEINLSGLPTGVYYLKSGSYNAKILKN